MYVSGLKRIYFIFLFFIPFVALVVGWEDKFHANIDTQQNIRSFRLLHFSFCNKYVVLAAAISSGC